MAGDRSFGAFDLSGRRTSEIQLNASPHCLAVDEEGNLYVGLKDRVEVYTRSGVLQNRWNSPEPQSLLTSIDVSGSHVFVADAGNRRVMHYNASGELLNTIGRKGEAQDALGFVVPHPYFDLAVGRDGLLRVANPGRHRIEFYTFDGALELSWGEVSMGIEGFAGCGNPVNFALLPDGRLVTCEKGLPRVKIYTTQGVFAGVVAGAELFPAYSFDGVSSDRTGELDVAVDSRGRILVLDTVGRIVRIFVPKDAG